MTAPDPTSLSKTGDLPRGDTARLRELVREVVDRTLGAAPAEKPAGTVKPRRRAARRARWVDWSATGSPGCSPVPGNACPLEPVERGGRKPAVAIGADHGAFRLKQQLKRYLEEELGYPVVDCGTHSEEAVDYPDIARDVAMAVAGGRAWRGVVLDAMGIGSGMAANRIPGVLCAVCHDVASVRNAREHNDANLLSLGSRVVNPGEARRLVRTFLSTEHGGGRHARRVAKIRALEAHRTPVQRGN